MNESFKETECTGYYTKGEQFNPGVSQTCPAPIDDFNAHYTGNVFKDGGCQQLIQNTNSCTVPQERTNLSSQCQAFVDQYLNYPGCIVTHRADQQFFGTTWRVYLNRDIVSGHNTDTRYFGPLWKQSNDAIKLEDQNGLTVDLYEY